MEIISRPCYIVLAEDGSTTLIPGMPPVEQAPYPAYSFGTLVANSQYSYVLDKPAVLRCLSYEYHGAMSYGDCWIKAIVTPPDGSLDPASLWMPAVASLNSASGGRDNPALNPQWMGIMLPAGTVVCVQVTVGAGCSVSGLVITPDFAPQQ